MNKDTVIDPLHYTVAFAACGDIASVPWEDALTPFRIMRAQSALSWAQSELCFMVVRPHLLFGGKFMKRNAVITWTLAIILLLAVPSTCQASAAGTPQELAYQDACHYFEMGDYEEAAQAFEQLGTYSDSTDYAIYSRALLAIRNEMFDDAIAPLEALAKSAFKDSDKYLDMQKAGNLKRREITRWPSNSIADSDSWTATLGCSSWR
jgi:hypothetical protein